MKSKGIKRTLTYVLVCLTILFATLVLSACDEKINGTVTTDTPHDLYIKTIGYDGQETMTVIIGFNGEDEKKLESTSNWHNVRRNGVLKIYQDVEITLNPSEIYDEVKSKLTDEDYKFDGVEYKRLKIALRYDTMYKSIKTNGEVSKVKNVYRHVFQLDETSQNEMPKLSLYNYNSATWYTLLICGVVLAAVIAVCLIAALRGKYGKRQQKQNKNIQGVLRTVGSKRSFATFLT